MSESMTITAAMTRSGLRPEKWTARDSPYLVKCRNRRPTRDGGLQRFLTLTQMVTDAAITAAGESKTWPYPFLFEGSRRWLFAFSDAIYFVDPSTFALTIIDTKDPDDPTGGTSKSITPGLDWHFLDFGDTWMLLNTACIVWQKRGGVIWVTDDVTILTGCTHGAGFADNGDRAILGGFDEDDFFARADWPAYWAQLRGALPDGHGDQTDTALGSADVRWSSMLAPDLLDLVDADDLMESNLPMDLRRRGEAGARSMPWVGLVLGMAELGRGVVVYGTGGVSFLEPAGKRYALRDFVGMTPHVGVQPGDTTRTHWAGSRAVQFFVDASNELWRLTPDGVATNLGYSEFLSTLSRNKLLLSYDAVNDELYAADGEKCLLYSQGRMCFAPRMPNRIYVHGREKIHSVSFPASDATSAEIETGTFTTKTGRIETLTSIWFHGLTTSGSDGWRVKVKYRLLAYQDFYVSDELVPDARGVVEPMIPVLQFRLVFTSTDHTKVTLEDFRYELGDQNASSAATLSASAPGVAME